MKVLKRAFFIMLSVCLSVGVLSFCSATCMADTQECHKEVKERVPSCHSEAPSESQSDNDNSCRCQHSIQSAVNGTQQIQMTLTEFRSTLALVQIREALLESRQSFQENRSRDLGPPGHVLESLLTYLSQSEHSPPVFV